MTTHTLEPAAQMIAQATSKPSFLYELGPDGARKVLDDIQAAPVSKLYVEEKWITVPAEAGKDLNKVRVQELMSQNDPAGSASGAAGLRAGSSAGR